MTLLEPAWLVLLLPVGLALVRLMPVRLMPGGSWPRLLRLALLVVVVIALARPAILLPRRVGTLVVVVDRSASMPADSAEVQAEILGRLETSRRSDDRLAVVTFGARSAVETAGDAPFAGFSAEVGAEASDLAGALDTALGLLPDVGSNRLLLVTDGRWTGREPSSAAARAALRGVAIDYRLLERGVTGDLAVERLEAPGEVSPGEGFVVSAWVKSPRRQEVEVELRRDGRLLASSGRLLASGRRQVPAGRSRFSFRDRAAGSGVQAYRITVRSVSGTSVDPQPENDTARFLVGIRGPRPVLVLSGGPTRTAELLQGGGLEARRLDVRDFTGSLEELAKYSAVVLDNAPADELGQSALENLAVWVRSAGGGLMMTGGQRSFGPGGYFRSPLEDVLPVSMELRQEHRKMALAMVVALDRSGSMAAPVDGGRTKMDLANLATAEVLDLLSPVDEFGAIAIDSAAHVILPLEQVGKKQAKRAKILRIASQGGGIYVYTALRSAVDQLLKSDAGARHVLLFADAADAEEPGDYIQLLELCRRANITVSVVGLGKDTDSDAAFLRDVARRGDGRAFFTSRADALPRIFAQDTFVVARSTFVEQSTALRFTAALRTLTGQGLGEPPPLGGYNLTYLRPRASLAAVTVDEYQAPVIASWQAGLGRALVYTGEVDGAFSGAVAGWAKMGDLLVSLARWTAGESAGLPGDVLVTQEFRRGLLRVRLHLDPERQRDPFVEMPTHTILKGVPGRTPVSEEQVPRWADPDTLEAEVQLSGDEVALGRLEVPGLGGVSLAPVRLPYAPEYAPAQPGAGHLALERLARDTGGRQRVDLGDPWKEFKRRRRVVEVAPWLLALAIVLLLLEVLERRTALLSSRLPIESGSKKPRPRPPGEPAPPPPEPVKEVPATPVDGGRVLSAMDRARQRASRRTRR